MENEGKIGYVYMITSPKRRTYSSTRKL